MMMLQEPERQATQSACYCGSTDGALITDRIRGGKHVRIVRCGGCAVVRKGDLDARQHVGLHHDDVQVKEIKIDVESENYRKRVKADVDRRVNVVKANASGDVILDVGAGMGHFLNAMEDAFATRLATEINPARLRALGAIPGVRAFDSSEAVLESNGRSSVDVITMFHVLEHMVEPHRELRRVRELLTADGTLFIEVPNHDEWLIGASASYRQFYYQDAHSYYFTARTLTELLRSTGFSGRVGFVQRYGLPNALHHIVRRRPQLDHPSRDEDTWTRPWDQIYAGMLGRMKKADTLWAQVTKVTE